MLLLRNIAVGVTVRLFLLLTCFHHVVSGQDDDGPLDHNVVMDPKERYILSWSAKEDDLIIEVQAATRGYVGLGFSPNGGMKGADIILGWLDDEEEPQLLDMYAVANGAPLVDASQDVELVSARRNETHTTLRFRRPWITCDENDDYLLSDDTVSVIYCLGEDAPDPEKQFFPYHQQHRGVKSLHLKNAKIPQNELEDGALYWDVLAPNVSLPDGLDTLYWCKMHKIPDLTEKHHFIGYKPLISAESAPFVHHMLVYECMMQNSTEHLEQYIEHLGSQCYSANMPLSWSDCNSPIVAWAIGSEGGMLPSHLGTPLGEEHNGAMYFMLEVHYDNPRKVSGITDQSGIRMYHTKKIRQHDTGVLFSGIDVGPTHIISPFRQTWSNIGHCDGRCTTDIYPPEGIKVISAVLHGHLLANGIRVQHIRGGKELPPVFEDNHYDFNFQQERLLKEERTVLPGDHLIISCRTNSSRKIVPTFGGLGTYEEMCLAYITYYPRTKLLGCRSGPAMGPILKTLGVNELYNTQEKGPRKKFEKGAAKEEKPVKKEKESAADNSSSLVMARKFHMLKIKEPFPLRNMSLFELLHERSLWRNKEVSDNMRKVATTGLYSAFCVVREGLGYGDTRVMMLPTVPYPEFDPYQPPQTQCPRGR